MRSVTPSGQNTKQESRRLDSHQHQPVYKTGAFLSRATSAIVAARPQHRCKESNPVGRFWRPPALPGAHQCKRFEA